MRARSVLAAAILLAWGATLAWHVKREYFAPAEVRLAEGAARLPPGAAYYALYRDGDRVGWAQSLVDTLPGGAGFVVEERMEGRLPGPAGEAPVLVETTVRLGPTLALESFRLASSGALGALSARGSVEGDSLLRWVAERGEEVDSARVPLDGPVVPATALAMRLAAGRSLDPGDRFRLPLFDPLTLTRREARFEVLRRETRTFADSADTDAEGEWRVAGLDTVRAWQVERRLGGLSLRLWVDEDGRWLEAELPGGLRLERTAFELAYYPYRDRR